MAMAAERKDLDLDHFLHPARAFRIPMDVVAAQHLTVQEKRAILASWASDACAVEAAYDFGPPPTSPLVRFADVMDALKQLDGVVAETPQYTKFIDRARRWKDLYCSGPGRRSAFA
jgi:hypothetical protein